LGQKLNHLRNGIALHGRNLHALWVQVHVHQTHTAVGVARHHLHPCALPVGEWLLQGPHIVHYVSAHIQAGLHDFGFVSVNRHWNPPLNQRPHHRQHARQFILQGNGGRTRSGGLSTHVQYMGPGIQQRFGMLQRACSVGVTATVREGVWRDVDDTHDFRKRQIDLKTGGLPERFGQRLHGQWGGVGLNEKTGAWAPVE
jgi:hypothetical protein